MKKSKGNKTFHTPNTQLGMGDSYGSGVRNPIGKIRDSYIEMSLPKKSLKKPPKSLA